MKNLQLAVSISALLVLAAIALGSIALASSGSSGNGRQNYLSPGPHIGYCAGFYNGGVLYVNIERNEEKEATKFVPYLVPVSSFTTFPELPERCPIYSGVHLEVVEKGDGSRVINILNPPRGDEKVVVFSAEKTRRENPLALGTYKGFCAGFYEGSVLYVDLHYNPEEEVTEFVVYVIPLKYFTEFPVHCPQNSGMVLKVVIDILN